MQKILWCLVVGLGIHSTLKAQQPAVYTIKAGGIVSQVISYEDQYLYNGFQQGTVWFQNASSLPAKLNYNVLYGEMQFIDTNGDTLALVEEHSLKKIVMDEQVFYHMNKNGFVELLTAQEPVKLARKQAFKILNSTFKLYGTSGYYSGTTYTPRFNYRKLYTQKIPGDLQLAKQTSYYFVDQNERIYQANKAILLRLFNMHKKAIEQYINTNKIDFTQEEDLKKLLAFCSQLDGE